MTLYRRWPEMNALLADLMTREWAGLVDVSTASTTSTPRIDNHRTDNHRDRLVSGIVGTVRALRANALFTRIIELDPQMVLPYLLERPGRSQELVLTLLVSEITAGQEAGEVRAGDPRLLARSVVLGAHGFTLSTQTMSDHELTDDRFDHELALLLDRYLQP